MFDVSSNRDHFALSIRLAIQEPRWKALYSLSQLAKVSGKHPKTIKKMLIRNKVPMLGADHQKKYVLLWDLRDYLGTKYIANKEIR